MVDTVFIYKKRSGNLVLSVKENVKKWELIAEAKTPGELHTAIMHYVEPYRIQEFLIRREKTLFGKYYSLRVPLYYKQAYTYTMACNDINYFIPSKQKTLF